MRRQNSKDELVKGQEMRSPAVAHVCTSSELIVLSLVGCLKFGRMIGQCDEWGLGSPVPANPPARQGPGVPSLHQLSSASCSSSLRIWRGACINLATLPELDFVVVWSTGVYGVHVVSGPCLVSILVLVHVRRGTCCSIHCALVSKVPVPGTLQPNQLESKCQVPSTTDLKSSTRLT